MASKEMTDFMQTLALQEKGPQDNTLNEKGGWIQKATKNKGGLHRSLGIPEDEKIPAAKVAIAAKKGGKVGKQARLAQTLGKLKKRKK